MIITRHYMAKNLKFIFFYLVIKVYSSPQMTSALKIMIIKHMNLLFALLSIFIMKRENVFMIYWKKKN